MSAQTIAVPVVVDKLTKTFGGRTVVDALTFSVQPGRVTGFLGPNGAGKTTTLRMLLSLVRPDAGTAQFGRRTFGELENPMTVVGAALDSSGFHPGYRVRDHLRVQATACGATDARVDEVIDVTGMRSYERQRIGKLSLGMKQRLTLADALIGSPSVLILDEPTNGLDPHGIAWLREFLRDEAMNGRTVLVSSHLLTEAENMIDDVVLIHEGRLVRSSSLADWRSSQTGSLTVTCSDPKALLDALRHLGLVSELLPEDVVRTIGCSEERLRAIATSSGIYLSSVASATATLEQLFFAATAPAANIGVRQ